LWIADYAVSAVNPCVVLSRYLVHLPSPVRARWYLALRQLECTRWIVRRLINNLRATSAILHGSSSNAVTRAGSSGGNGRPVGGGPLTRSQGFGSISSSSLGSLSSPLSSPSPSDSFWSSSSEPLLALALTLCHSAIHLRSRKSQPPRALRDFLTHPLSLRPSLQLYWIVGSLAWYYVLSLSRASNLWRSMRTSSTDVSSSQCTF